MGIRLIIVDANETSTSRSTLPPQATFTARSPSATMESMGKAGQALKQALERQGVSQYALAATLGIERANVHRWVHEIRDPTAERVYEITEALKQLNPEAAKEFVRLYLGKVVEESDIEDS